MNASEFESEVKSIVASVLARIGGEPGTSRGQEPDGFSLSLSQREVPIEASARHIHVNAEAMERLFGPGAALWKKRDLSQPGEFLAEQRVKLVTSAGEIANVAVLGPLRQHVQAEISATDGRTLGLRPPLNVSGDLDGAADVFIVGERGMVEARGSVIVAKAHVHLPPAEAEACGFVNGGKARVKVESRRPVIFSDVVVRVSEHFAPAVHIDFDEANACMLDGESRAFLLCGEEPNGALPRNQKAPLKGLRPLRIPVGEVCEEKIVTEAVARKMVAMCEGNEIAVKRATIVTPSAMDVFSAAKKTLRRVSG